MLNSFINRRAALIAASFPKYPYELHYGYTLASDGATLVEKDNMYVVRWIPISNSKSIQWGIIPLAGMYCEYGANKNYIDYWPTILNRTVSLTGKTNSKFICATFLTKALKFAKITDKTNNIVVFDGSKDINKFEILYDKALSYSSVIDKKGWCVVRWVPIDNCLQVTCGIPPVNGEGYLGMSYEYDINKKYIDFWGVNNPNRTVNLTGGTRTTFINASFYKQFEQFSFVKDVTNNKYIYKGEFV